MSEFEGRAIPLADNDFEKAAAKLMCDVAAVRAVVEVESGGRTGFLDDKRPKILFESRWFHNLTNGRFDASHPHLSTPTWIRNYLGGPREYGRLEEAVTLDRQAALSSASWGMFQILGVNYRLAGSGNVEEFVRRQCESESEHVLAFVSFVISNKLDDELRDRRWADFASGYNGPAYRENRYDEKLAAAFEKYSGGVVAPTTADVQRALNLRGANVEVDGQTGPATRNAIRDFQKANGLVTDGVAGPKTLAALGLTHEPDPIATSRALNG